MARLFDNASSEYLSMGSAVLSGTPISMACWYNSDDATLQQVLMLVSDTAADDDYFAMTLMGDVAGDYIRARTKRSTTTGAITTAGYSVSTWEHACAVFASSTSRAIYINGGDKGTDATSKIPISLDTTAIGVAKQSSIAAYMSGLIAEAAIWNIALTDAEVLLLSGGYSPLFIHPQNLVAYWPLIRESVGDGTGDGLDIVGGNNLTATNTPVNGDHPRIIYPVSPQVGPVLAAVVPTVGQGALIGEGWGW